MNYNEKIAALTEKQINSIHKLASSAFKGNYESELREIFKDYSNKKENDDILEAFGECFKIGFLYGRVHNNKTKKA